MIQARPAPPPRGEFVDVGGRRLHIVRAGPNGAAPLVLLEAGSFGFSADWGVVQEKLAALGLRSLAYDRAGMALSDPGPAPRDGLAIVSDLEKLLETLGEYGPLILVGHSMAGLHVHLFAGRNPDKVAGLVLVDAVTPTVAVDVAVRHGAVQYQRLAKVVAWAATGHLLRVLNPGDMIGLTADAALHKSWAFADAAHRRVSADEILQWDATVAQAAEAGPLDPKWPVVVVTAGPAPTYLKPRAIQADPAYKARKGYVENVRKANHASLIGRKHADAVVRAIDFVARAAA
jgi:pimeloyl-ACP methyl ester carboxylesterase